MDGDMGRCPHLSPGRVTEPLGSLQRKPKMDPVSLWGHPTNPQDPALNPSSHQSLRNDPQAGKKSSGNRSKCGENPGADEGSRAAIPPCMLMMKSLFSFMKDLSGLV